MEAFIDGGWYVVSIKDKCENQPSYYKFMDGSIVLEPLFDFIDFCNGQVVRLSLVGICSIEKSKQFECHVCNNDFCTDLNLAMWSTHGNDK